MNAFSGREGGGFPVLSEERGCKGTLQEILLCDAGPGAGSNREGDTEVTFDEEGTVLERARKNCSCHPERNQPIRLRMDW
jgi:hypothetical protein